jgi:hypothetical protein
MINQPSPRTAWVYIRGIRRDLKDRFKAWCSKRGSTMTSELVKFMEKMIREDEALIKHLDRGKEP